MSFGPTRKYRSKTLEMTQDACSLGSELDAQNQKSSGGAAWGRLREASLLCKYPLTCRVATERFDYLGRKKHTYFLL